MPHQHSILTAHNILFTILTTSLIAPKIVLSYQGQSAVPTTLDLIYGLFMTLLYFWLEAYRSSSPRVLVWYFEMHFPSIVRDLVRDICEAVGTYMGRLTEASREIYQTAEEGQQSHVHQNFPPRPLSNAILVDGTQQTVHMNTGAEPATSQVLRRRPVGPNPNDNFDVAGHNKFFTGREDYLENLQQFFVPRVESRPRRCLLVHGVGGVGKTQICLKFAEENSERFWRIFWVDATTAESIELSLRDIATDPDARASEVQHSTESVLQWLSRIEHDWLIVFDNASGDHYEMAEYIPKGNQGNILFTSRNLSLAGYISHEACIKVDNMEEEDAISLLLKSSSIDESSMQQSGAARLIVKELGCFPLAVDQAGAAIAGGLCNIDDYLLRYSQCCQALLANPTFKDASHYGRTVYGTWHVSFMAINAMGTGAAECAIFILHTFAFLHHENIAEDIIKRAAEALKQLTLSDGSGHLLPPQLLQLDQGGSWDPFFFQEGIHILLSFSLIKTTAVSGIYSLHPLVHSWSRDSMSHEEQHTSSSVALMLLSSSITFHFTSKDYAFRRTLIPHIKAVNQCTAALGIQISYDDKQYTNFGLVFYEAGYWKEAEELQVQAVHVRKRVLGEDHPTTLESMGNLASTYRNQGRLKEAEELEVQVMHVRKRIFEDEHPDTLTSMGNLASTYWNQGRWKEAEELQVQVTEASVRLFGEEHPDTLASMRNLASTYWNMGCWKEAEELQVQVMEASLRVLGKEHPDTLTSMRSLASTYQNQGQWKEAEELQIQVIQTSLRVLGDEHPSMLASMGSLALMYCNQGQWKEAEELQVQVMEASLRVLGEEHPDTLTSMRSLASTYQNQGQWKEAEELQIQVMQTSLSVFGEEHPSVLESMGSLASMYCNQGQWKEAEELQIQVIQTSLMVFGKDHPIVLARMGSLASTYQNQGWWKEAEELQIQVMQSSLKVLGEDHPDTLTSMGNLASTYHNQGSLKEAEKLEVQVMQNSVKVLGEEHPNTLTSMVNLAQTLKSQGHNDQAISLLQNALNLQRRSLGLDHPSTVKSVNTLDIWCG